MNDDIYKKVKDIVVNVFEIEENEIDYKTEFKSLDISSLMVLDVITDLEREFKVRVSNNDIQKLISIEGIVKYIEEKKVS